MGNSPLVEPLDLWSMAVLLNIHPKLLTIDAKKCSTFIEITSLPNGNRLLRIVSTFWAETPFSALFGQSLWQASMKPGRTKYLRGRLDTLVLPPGCLHPPTPYRSERVLGTKARADEKHDPLRVLPDVLSTRMMFLPGRA